MQQRKGQQNRAMGTSISQSSFRHQFNKTIAQKTTGIILRYQQTRVGIKKQHKGEHQFYVAKVGTNAEKQR